MLTTIQSVGAAPEDNLKNLLQEDEKVYKQGTHSGFDTEGRYHQKSKTGGISGPSKRPVSFFFFLKKVTFQFRRVVVIT